MKIKMKYAVGIIILFVLVISLVAYNIQKNRSFQNDKASYIASLGPSGNTPETIEGLRTAIAAYEEQIDAHVRDAAQTGVYWKILAVRLQDKNLHNLALEALERAIYYNPTDAALYNMTGVSAGYLAKNYIDFFTRDNNAERQRLYDLAETAYLKAIGIDGRYSRPRYGLGVLYVFELDRPEDAIPHLERYLELSANDTDAMFVLARAYYETNAFQMAIDLYDKIITVAREDSKKREAQNNKQIIMGFYNG